MVLPVEVNIYISSERGKGEKEPHAVSGRDNKGKEVISKTVVSTFNHGRAHNRLSKGGGWTSYNHLDQILVPYGSRGKENDDRSSEDKFQQPLRYQVSDWYRNQGRRNRGLCGNNFGNHSDG